MQEEKFKGSHHEQLVKDGVINDDFDASLQKKELDFCYVVILRNSGYNEMTETVESESRTVKIRKESFERFTFLDHQRLFVYHTPESEKETIRKTDNVFKKKFGEDYKELLKAGKIKIVLPKFERKAATKATTEK